MVATGETETEAPVPTGVPPHDPVNHSVVAPVPFDPPETVKVVLAPLQITFVPVASVGDVDNVFTVTVTVAQVVVLQVPLYRT